MANITITIDKPENGRTTCRLNMTGSMDAIEVNALIRELEKVVILMNDWNLKEKKDGS